jgi:hypothetical protein
MGRRGMYIAFYYIKYYWWEIQKERKAKEDKDVE